MKKYISPTLIQPALWVIAFQIIGALIGMTTSGNMEWYDALNQSSLTPPDIAFGIVWSLLYVSLALCGWLTWERASKPRGLPVFMLYWLVMPLNWMWSFIFFEFHLVAIGFFWILALNASMIAFIAAAWAHNRAAAWLMVPTLIWCSFAAYLNYAIWVLN